MPPVESDQTIRGQPAVSVLMPVYNAERYVAQAVRSVLDQTFQDFEFIIVNDGSVDRSLQIVQKEAMGDPRVFITSRPNTGIVGALNDGLGMARGEYIARMDADDVCLPDRLHKQVAYLQANPACAAVGCAVDLIDQEGHLVSSSPVETDHQQIDDLLINARANAMWHPTIMMRRRIVQWIGGYRKDYETAEDIDLFLRVAEHGRLANLPDALLRYRLHPGSIGGSKRVIQAKRACAAVHDARVRRGLPPLDQGGWADDVAPTVSDHHRKWAWWALEGGNIATARRHAFRAMTGQPLSPDSWRLLFCAMRGR